MSLDKLDYILAVAEEQTLTRAAKRLFITQPTLTNYINKLEGELAVKLFDRSVTPVRVTEAGALYIERMKAIQMESDALIQELRQIGSKRRVFTLGIGTTRGNHWLPYIVPELCKRFPDVNLQIREGIEDNHENAVHRGDIDLAFGVMRFTYPELQYEEIDEESMLLVIPRSYDCVAHLSEEEALPQKPYLIKGEDVGSIPFIVPYLGSGLNRGANFLMERAHITPGKVISCTNMNTAFHLAASGVGALFLTVESFIQLYPEFAKKLAFCTTQLPLYTRRSTACFRPDNRNREIIDAVIEITRNTVIPALHPEK